MQTQCKRSLTIQSVSHLSVATSSALIHWHTSLRISQGLQPEPSYDKTMDPRPGMRPICKNWKFLLTLLPFLLCLELLQSALKSDKTHNLPTNRPHRHDPCANTFTTQAAQLSPTARTVLLKHFTDFSFLRHRYIQSRGTFQTSLNVAGHYIFEF